MALGKREIGTGGKSADDGNFGPRGAQKIEMPAPADAIADQPGHANGGIEARETSGHCGNRARNTGRVSDEDNRRVEPFRNLGGRAFVASRRRGIEQTHHALR